MKKVLYFVGVPALALFALLITGAYQEAKAATVVQVPDCRHDTAPVNTGRYAGDNLVSKIVTEKPVAIGTVMTMNYLVAGKIYSIECKTVKVRVAVLASNGEIYDKECGNLILKGVEFNQTPAPSVASTPAPAASAPTVTVVACEYECQKAKALEFCNQQNYRWLNTYQEGKGWQCEGTGAIPVAVVVLHKGEVQVTDLNLYTPVRVGTINRYGNYNPPACCAPATAKEQCETTKEGYKVCMGTSPTACRCSIPPRGRFPGAYFPDSAVGEKCNNDQNHFMAKHNLSRR